MIKSTKKQLVLFLDNVSLPLILLKEKVQSELIMFIKSNLIEFFNAMQDHAIEPF